MLKQWRAWITLATACAVLLTAMPAGDNIVFPKDFRTWVHVKSALITAAHPAFASEGGLHHIYANSKAVEGYASGRFPDGSVIVYELLAAQEKDGVISEGTRRRLDVMVKDDERFRATAGWGYQRFWGVSPKSGALGDSAVKACAECHARAREHGFIFSRIR